MAGKRDYYEVLGVQRNAAQDDIKNAYRKVALRYHPDRNQGSPEAEERFKEATEAYETLRDASKRRLYDQMGHNAFQGAGNQASGDFDFSGIFQDLGMDDIFSSFFDRGRRGGGQRRVRRGSDLRYNLTISFQESLLGKKVEISVPRSSLCTNCKGSGAKPGTSPERCSSCQGSGQVTQKSGFFRIATNCPTCQGSGTRIRELCKQCHGKGKLPDARVLNVDIPAGVDHGNRVRLENEGEPGEFGGPPGDLYIVVEVLEEKNFVRHGLDIHTEQNIPFSKAALGGSIDIIVPGRDVIRMKVPEGTPSGKIFKISKQGAPQPYGRGHGDLHVRVRVAVPKKVSKKARKLIEELANELNNEL